MRLKFPLFMFFICFSVAVMAQKQPVQITAEEAKDHVGEKVTICAKVVEVYYNEKANGQPTILNFGAPYPKQSFAAIIWKDDLSNFDYEPVRYLKDKEICITGIIKLYKGKPEIEIKTQYQVYE